MKLLPRCFLVLITALLMLSDCQPDSQPQPPQNQTSPEVEPRAVLVTPSPRPNTPTPSPLVYGTETQAAWTATFQAFTQAGVARQTRAAQIMADYHTEVAKTGVVNEATLEASFYQTETAVVNILLTTVTPQVRQSLRSPDGKWLAQIIQHGCVQIQSSEHWPDAYDILKINDQVIATQYHYCGGQGAYGFGGKFWTTNSRFFYYTDAEEGWPDGGYPWRRPISRFETITGKSKTLYGAIFSPGQSRIAGTDGNALVVWEVDGDTVRRFSAILASPSPASTVWSAWSPDGRALAYLTQIACQDTYPCPTVLTKVELQTGQQVKLLDSSAPPMLTIEWKQPDILTLWGADFHSTYLFDLKQNRLTLVVPTITPIPSAKP